MMSPRVPSTFKLIVPKSLVIGREEGSVVKLRLKHVLRELAELSRTGLFVPRIMILHQSISEYQSPVDISMLGLRRARSRRRVERPIFVLGSSPRQCRRLLSSFTLRKPRQGHSWGTHRTGNGRAAEPRLLWRRLCCKWKESAWVEARGSASKEWTGVGGLMLVVKVGRPRGSHAVKFAPHVEILGLWSSGRVVLARGLRRSIGASSEGSYK